MPQKGSKVLSLNQKAQICEASLGLPNYTHVTFAVHEAKIRY